MSSYNTSMMTSLLKKSSSPLFMTNMLLLMLSSLIYFFKSGSMMMLLFVVCMLIFYVVEWSESYMVDMEMEHLYLLETLNMGMMFFIFSELFLFVTFFWAWASMKWCSPSETMMLSIPSTVTSVSVYSIPMLNTFLLLSSAVTVTMAHHNLIINGNKNNTLIFMMMTLVLGTIFLMLQYVEYTATSFTMSDNNYCSLFFLLTGFHGFHVFLGLVFLLISLMFMLINKTTNMYHMFFQLAVYYYHFVDVVWLGLVLFLYC